MIGAAGSEPVTVKNLGLLWEPQGPDEWYAACPPCNWYGQSHAVKEDAVRDAKRHRRHHKSKRS